MMHCAFVLAICDILLSPSSPGIKCKDKSVARRVHAFMVSNTLNLLKVCIKNHSQISDIQRAVENNEPATQEMMAEIAKKEIEEAEQAANKKCQKLRTEIVGDKEDINTIEEEDDDDDDYDNFVSFFNTLCNLFL